MEAQRMLEFHKFIRIDRFEMLLKIMFLGVILYDALFFLTKYKTFFI